ncbi:MAG TPA: hypothetical protein VHB77_00470, partial [Planctomycetaceae bacterium]|nr:hypothetical protein [Planctomycetaceae bacterium]
MRRLLKFLLHWSPSMHVPHFFDWHTYVKRPNLQWPPSHKSLWHLSIGAAAGSAILVLLLLWSGIHGQPTAIKSPETKLADELDLGSGQEDDPFASAGPKSRVADEGPDPFAMTLAGNPDETAPLSGNESSDEMFATAKPVAARTNDSTDAFDSEFAPPIEVSQKAPPSGPTIGDSFGDEPAIVMEAKSNESPAEPDDNLEPFAPEAEPKIALEAVPAETPAEPEPEPIAEPKIVMEAPDETTAEPEPELEPIAAQPEPKIALDEKPDELPAEPDDAPVPPAKTLEVALAPMPELGKSEPIDEEPPAAPYKVVQVAQANRPHPFGEDDDEPMRKPAPAPK